MRIDLEDPTLFGNDAAEDESPDVFESYFMRRDEVDDFQDSGKQIQFLRAYRGEGKSAIIRHVYEAKQNAGIWAVKATGAAISPTVETDDPNVWNRQWQRSILNLVACEVGSKIGVAWSDDAMALVEEAELSGFRQKSLVSSVFSRLNISGLPELKTPSSKNQVARLSRYMEGKEAIWVFVDDIDEDFRNTETFRARISAFFSACRQLSNTIPNVVVRTSIRPNVWRILRAHSESLSKTDQYAVDLRWDTPSIQSMLARRIEGYLRRKGRIDIIDRFAKQRGAVRENSLCELVFDSPMEWGFNVQRQKPILRDATIVLSTLCRQRPRWLIELCRLATKNRRQKDRRVSISDLTSVLGEFGRERVEDLAAEYRSECPQVQEIINAFSGTQEDFTTDQLMSTIKSRVLSGLNVRFASRGGVSKPTPVAAFLYEIGFLTARSENADGTYTHYAFAQNPELLHNRTNIDHGLSWEIHPVFRQVLGLRDESGRKRR